MQVYKLDVQAETAEVVTTLAWNPVAVVLRTREETVLRVTMCCIPLLTFFLTTIQIHLVGSWLSLPEHVGTSSLVRGLLPSMDRIAHASSRKLPAAFRAGSSFLEEA